jgi:hypothetical protein
MMGKHAPYKIERRLAACVVGIGRPPDTVTLMAHIPNRILLGVFDEIVCIAIWKVMADGKHMVICEHVIVVVDSKVCIRLGYELFSRSHFIGILANDVRAMDDGCIAF